MLINLSFEDDETAFRQNVSKVEELSVDLEYFNKVLSKIARFAVYYLKMNFSADVNTNSRIESLHAVLKRILTAKLNCKNFMKLLKNNYHLTEFDKTFSV